MLHRFKSEFSRNVISLLTGTGIAQLIPFILTPVYTRLFSPEEMGQFAFYISITTFLTVIATGRYEMAILLPKKEKTALDVMKLSIRISLVFSLFLLILVLLLHDILINAIDKPYLKGVLYFIPLFVFVGAIVNILTMWVHRKKQFKLSGYSKITLNASEYIVNSAVGFEKNGIALTKASTIFKGEYKPIDVLGYGYKVLLIGKLTGLLVTFVYLARRVFWMDKLSLSNPSKGSLLKVAKKYSDFPKVNLLHVISDELKTSGLTFVIDFFFTTIILGFYSQTYRLLRAPLAIIGTSFGHVFFQKAAEMHANKESITDFIHKTTKKLFLIGAPLFLLIFILSPYFFDFFLGDGWEEVGVYAQYICPWLFVNFVISPVSQVAIIVNKQFQFWMVSLIGNILVFMSIIVAGYFFNNIKVGLLLISVSQVIFYLFVYHWIIKISRTL